MSFNLKRGLRKGMPESQLLKYERNRAAWEELHAIEQATCRELYHSKRKRLVAVNSTGGFKVGRHK